jgi:hypothetical protein
MSKPNARRAVSTFGRVAVLIISTMHVLGAGMLLHLDLLDVNIAVLMLSAYLVVMSIILVVEIK